MRSAITALAATMVILALAAAIDPTDAQPTVGFVEDFTSDLGTFGGGATYTNPGTGGVDGASDGFLRISRSVPANFGARSFGTAYIGDYIAAGITHIRFHLNDVENQQPFELHFAIGSGSTNFWQYNPPLAPPHNAWQQFEVNLTEAASFTQIKGTGTFAAALSAVTNILFRHDLAPYTSEPDPAAGELGLDKIEFLGTSPVAAGTWGRVKALYR